MNQIQTIVANTATSSGIKLRRIYFSPIDYTIHSVESENVTRSNSDNFQFNDDCLLFAGMGDIHIHAREDKSLKNTYKEDFKSACCAALNGGVVHVGDMPNNPIPPIDDLSYSEKVLLSKTHDIPFLMYAGVGPSTRPLSFEVPYKAFMGPSIGDLFFKTNEELEAVIRLYQNQSVSFHCEDPIILEQNVKRENHFLARPIEAEILATDFALSLIKKYQLKGKLCHYSSKDGLQKIIAAKQSGVDVETEVTPQHLFFSEEKIMKNYSRDAHLFQMNPPIRHEADRENLLWALKNGHIDYLATDHAPHSMEEKLKGTSGIPGLDTFALFTTHLMNAEKVSPEIIAKIASENPGKFFNRFLPVLKKRFSHYEKWGKGFGLIEPGYSASFTILNLKKPMKFEKTHLKTKAHWSPFLGHQFSGSIEAMFLAGQKL